MAGYLLRRALAAVPTLLGISLLAFAVLSLLPADPVLTWSEAGAPLSAEGMERLRRELGTDRSPVRRYADWLAGAARLDFGTSLREARPVLDLVGEALPWTLLLNLCAVAAIYGLGLPIGWAASRRPGGILDRSSRGLLIAVYVVPPFAAALLLQRLLSVRLRLLPLQGVAAGDATGPAAAAFDLALHLLLPTLCLALSGWAFAAHFARAAFRSLLAPGPLAAARARGISGWRLARHFAPNAAAPFVTLLGAIVPALLAGSVVVEEIFSWPGLGRLMLRSVEGRDYPVVLALMMLSASAVLAGQLLIDLIYPALDPRLRDVVAREASRRD
jgi:peptide/nickel transport system permease protein